MADSEERLPAPPADEDVPPVEEKGEENVEPPPAEESSPAENTEPAAEGGEEFNEEKAQDEGEPPQVEGEKVETQEEETKEEDAHSPEAGGDAAPEQKQPEESSEEKPEGEVKSDTPAGEEPPGEEKPEQETEEKEKEEVKEEGKEEEPLPNSEDFDKGEKQEEEPLAVSGEVLSREGTPPPGESPEDIDVRPGTPKREPGEDAIYEEEEVEIVPKYNRDELIERYHDALQKREALNQRNHALQHKLAEYFKRKKTEDTRQEVDRNVTDQEQRYTKYMSNLEELRQQEAGERESYNELIEEMKERKASKQVLVESEWNQYCEFKKSVALSSINSRTGRTLTAKEFEIYETSELKKEAEVSQVRLENIKLRNRLRKRELQLKQKEELAEGLHLIDFEQLKIENQTYNEKIEERNEELMKLRKKITSTVQVLTHLKEKLQFVQAENHVAKQELNHIEEEVAKKRDVLSRTKQARDALRHDNSKLQQKCGLLGNHMLLRNYEEGVDKGDELSYKLEQLKRTHAELTLSINGVKKKIEQAKAQTQ